jgi:hypothetical protein
MVAVVDPDQSGAHDMRPEHLVRILNFHKRIKTQLFFRDAS